MNFTGIFGTLDADAQYVRLSNLILDKLVPVRKTNR